MSCWATPGSSSRSLDGDQQLSSEAISGRAEDPGPGGDAPGAGRGEQARVSLDPVQLDISELCKETASDLSIIARDKGISLRRRRRRA